MKPRAAACARWAARIVVCAFLALAVAVAWLHLRGFPGFVSRRVIDKLQRRGLTARVGRVYLRLPAELVARNVSIYPRPGAGQPVMEARELSLRLHPRSGRGRPDWLRGAALRGGVFHMVPPGMAGESAPAAEPLSIAEIAADLELAPDALIVRNVEARFRGVRLQARGRVAGGAGLRPDPDARSAFPDDWEAQLRAQAHRFLAAARALDEIDSASEPVIHARFDVDLDHPERNGLELTMRGGGGAYRGLRFERWRLSAELRDNAWRLAPVSIRWARGYLEGEASYAPAENRFEARMSGELPVRDWLHLPVPAAAAGTIDRLYAHAGRARIEAATAGAVPLSEWREGLHGGVEVGAGEAADIPFERIAGRFRMEGTVLHFEQVDALIGRGPAAGPVRGRFQIDRESGRFEGQADTAFDPAFVLPLLTARQAMLVGAAVYLDAPPRVAIAVSGAWGRDDELRIRGRFEGGDFVYNGSAVRHAEANIEVENEVMKLRDVVIKRAEGRLTGWLEQRFRTQEAVFDADSTLHPHALARMVSPFTHRLLQAFRFEGPVRVVGRGRATYGKRHDHDFDLRVEGERMGVRWALADRLAFDVEARGQNMALRNVRGEWHGGSGAGTVELEPAEPPEDPVRYRAEVRVDGADFGAIMRDLSDADATAYSGRISVEGRLAGAIGDGQGRGAVGEGRVRIREGRLMQIPLFGGLSRGLARLYPGLGFAAQTDFHADIAIAEGRIRTDNAQLEGGAISLRARGYYGIENRIRMVAQVRPLRSGLIAGALRIVTFPLTRLLEFDVTGTLEEPRWEPRNLPKELFLMFD